MAKYDVRIEADAKYPILLSNGNEVGSGDDTIQFTEDNNSATITFEFYKCADGENCLILPRKWCYFSLPSKPADANTDETDSLPANFASPPDVAPHSSKDASLYNSRAMGQ